MVFINLPHMDIDVPHEHKSKFEPQIVKKQQTSLECAIEGKIFSLYAKDMTTRDIDAKICEIYGLEVLEIIVSRITNTILPVVKEWQQRPLEEIYAVVFFDAIRQSAVKGRL